MRSALSLMWNISPSRFSLLLFLIISTSLPPSECRRAGGGLSMGRGRGSSGARSGGGLFGGGGGGSFGGGASRGRQPIPASNNMGRKLPGHGSSSRWGGGGFGTGQGMGHGHRQHGGNYGGSGWNRGAAPRYSKSGVGSFVRSNSFKNAIVGAAAGYLTYQAGKAIIRAAAGPMYWNSRPYYWGSNYFQPRHGQTNVCRMPVAQDDPQFGNVYFQDQSRPREIVWGCGYYEYCCGYECCRGGASGGYGRGIGLGWASTLILYSLFHF